ncbi:MAG: phosphatidylglycerophosphatase A family protein [Planctomycetota bacterium]|jgi:phosphatidylglycerophosphatase A
MSGRDRLYLWLSASGGLGLSPVAPGTVGTLGGVLLAWALGFAGSGYLIACALAIAALYAGGRKLGDWAERHAAGKDPQFFVVDEVLGYLIAVTWIAPPSALTLAVGFLLFRLFDILKPPPCRTLERAGGGDGILLDDVMAGFYALAVLSVLRYTLFDPDAWVLGGGALG